MTLHNYRPPLKTCLRLRHGLFWGCDVQMPRWRTVVAVVIIAAAYPTVAYITEHGDRKAAEAENVKLKEQVRWHTSCMSQRYMYPRIPPPIDPRAKRKSP